jgi:hypothetical protein
MGILKKGLLGLVIAPAIYGGTRSTVNYASKFFGINPSIKDPLIAGLAIAADVAVVCLTGGDCKCCCKKEEKTEE